MGKSGPKMSSASFSDLVMDVVRRIPKGRVMTYADVAHALGCSAYRAVGQAMKNNRNGYWTDPTNPDRVPCHRVVAAGGELGGFSIGQDRKIRLLAEEGIEIDDGRIVDFERRRFHPFPDHFSHT